MVSDQPSARRRSSLLAFKGPAQPKRERKKTVLIDPIVPRRASLEGKGVQKGVKRRRTSGASDGDKVDMKKADRKKRNKGKKRAREEPHDDEDEGDSSDADSPSVRSYTRTIPRSVISTRWTTLSSSACEDLRYEVEQAGRSTLDALSSHSSSAPNLKALFASFADDLDALLSTLPVPPLPSAVSSSSKNGKGKQVVLGAKLDEGEMKRKIALLETALEAEEADVEALSARVEDEKRLLKKEETLLNHFIEATTEAREVRKDDLQRRSTDPSVASLLSTRPSASSSSSASLLVPGLAPSSLFASSPKLSSAWFAEPLSTRGRTEGVGASEGKGKKRIKTSLDSVEVGQSAEADEGGANGEDFAVRAPVGSVVDRADKVLRRLGRAARDGGGDAITAQKGKKRRKLSE